VRAWGQAFRRRLAICTDCCKPILEKEERKKRRNELVRDGYGLNLPFFFNDGGNGVRLPLVLTSVRG
jgi:hypothetical protein